MGSVGLGNTAALGAFNNRIYTEGLDLGRCQINQALGVFVADPATTFRAGMLVMRSSTGLVQASDGTDVLGVAKWNHATALYAAVVDEAIVLTGTTASNLAHPTVSNVKVSSAAGGAGSDYTLTTDYTVNATNGTVTRAGGGSITSGSTVYVAYTFQITAADLLQLQGQNFWNNVDEVSQADGRCTVITDATIIFTSQYDTTRTYTLTSTGSNLYACTTGGKAGLFTNDSGAGSLKVGRVLQVPTASDPFLGVLLFREPDLTF